MGTGGLYTVVFGAFVLFVVVMVVLAIIHEVSEFRRGSARRRELKDGMARILAEKDE